MRTRSPRGQGERLRHEIVRATESLLIKNGDADRVSIRAIADAVGVTPPSIYLHFGDKEELLFAVCQAQFAALEAEFDRTTAGVDDPLERLTAMGEAYVRFGVEHPEQYRILLMSKHDVVSRADFESDAIPGTSAFRRLLGAVQECMDAGYFEPDDPFVVAATIWCVVHGLTSLRIAVPGFPVVGEQVLQDHVFTLITRGLARQPTPGRRRK